MLEWNQVQSVIRREDPPRNEPRARLRVVVRDNCHATTIPGVAGRLGPGTHDVVVYKSDVPEVTAKVEDASDVVDRARDLLRKEWERFWDNKARGGNKAFADQGKAFSPEEPITNMPPEIRRIAREFTGSLEAHFYRLMGETRGINPLVSCEVVEELEPPKSEQQHMVEQVVKGLSPAAQQAANSGDNQRAVEEMAAKIADLEKELDRKQNKRGPGRPRKDSES